MAHIPLPSIDVYRKLNGKRLLTFGTIAMLMLTSLTVIAVRQARAITYGGPWWFLPTTWHYKTGVGSNRTMTMYVYPVDTSIPSPITINTTGKVSFDLIITAPDESGLANITMPAASVSVEPFYIGTIRYLGITIYVLGDITAKGDGYGLLDTVGGNLNVDVFCKVIGDGNGGYTIANEVTNNVTGPSRPGDAFVYLPIEIKIYRARNPEDPRPIEGLEIIEPWLLYLTTGFSRTVMAGPAYPSGSASISGKQMNATGVPFDPYTGEFTVVGTVGCLDLYDVIVGLLNTYIDFLFKETMASKPDPPMIPGDINGDGIVDLDDFAVFSATYGTSTGQPAYKASCDLNQDDKIDLDDFAIFAGNYGKSWQ